MHIITKAYTVSCPAGLHYNPSIEKCDWPENTECVPQQNGQCHFYNCNKFEMFSNTFGFSPQEMGMCHRLLRF